MSALIAEGKVLTLGLSEVDEEALRRAHAVTPVTAVQNRMNMSAREDEGVLAARDELGIAYTVFSPLMKGFLSARPNQDTSVSNRSSVPRSASPVARGSPHAWGCLPDRAASGRSGHP